MRRTRLIGWLLAAVAGLAGVLWLSGIGAHAIDAGRLMGWIAAGQTTRPVERLPHPLARDGDGALQVADLAGTATVADLYPPALYPADLYLPPGGDALDRRAGIVLVPGASPGGKDEPLLVAFAEILAATGFVVLVPDLPGLRQQQVDPDHAADIAAAASYLSSQLDRRPVAVAAISYAVGPAVLAAANQEATHPIAMILGIGGYYDALAATNFITTGHLRGPDGGWIRRMPNEYGKWVFVRSNLARISSHGDRAVLDEIVRRKLGDPSAPVDALAATLGPEGQAIWRLLANDDPDSVPALVNMLPAAIRTALDGLDLAHRDLGDLATTLVLVHGADDPILPPEGSVALANAVPVRELYLLDSLTHVELSLASLGDAWTLYRICWSLTGWRDRLAGGG